MDTETVVVEPKQEPKVAAPVQVIEVDEGSWKPAPKTFEDQQRLATMYLKSRVLPARFTDAAQVLTALHFASEHFPKKELTALREIAVINNTPCLFGTLPLALVQRSGLLESMSESLAGEGELMVATCTVKRKGLDPITRTFSWADAKKAGLTSNGTYQKYPKRMLQMRARSWTLKDGFADVLAGIAIAEYDFNATGEEIEVNSLEKLKKLNGVEVAGSDLTQ